MEEQQRPKEPTPTGSSPEPRVPVEGGLCQVPGGPEPGLLAAAGEVPPDAHRGPLRDREEPEALSAAGDPDGGVLLIRNPAESRDCRAVGFAFRHGKNETRRSGACTTGTNIYVFHTILRPWSCLEKGSNGVSFSLGPFIGH